MAQALSQGFIEQSLPVFSSWVSNRRPRGPRVPHHVSAASKRSDGAGVHESERLSAFFNDAALEEEEEELEEDFDWEAA